MPMNDRAIGAILAGGAARRLGGGDKCLQRLAGRTILSRIVACLEPQCRHLLLNANGDPERFAGFGLPVVPDRQAGLPGPLAGLLAILDHVAAFAPEASDVLTVPGDTPFLPSDLLARLRGGRSDDRSVACAASGGRIHPVVALWPVSIREDLRTALVRGERGVGRFADRHAVAVVEWEGPDPFVNVNTPDDLAAAEKRAGG